jgi:hypothetical protein
MGNGKIGKGMVNKHMEQLWTMMDFTWQKWAISWGCHSASNMSNINQEDKHVQKSSRMIKNDQSMSSSNSLIRWGKTSPRLHGPVVISWAHPHLERPPDHRKNMAWCILILSHTIDQWDGNLLYIYIEDQGEKWAESWRIQYNPIVWFMIKDNYHESHGE